MQLAAAICTYASPNLLRRCLESLHGLVDLNIIIHGRFKGFPEVMNHADSLFATMQIIENYRNVEMTNLDESMTQMQHRNHYLKVATKEGVDWLLVIDDDDYILKHRSDFQRVRHWLEQTQEDIDNQQTMDHRWFLYDVLFVQEENDDLPTRDIWKRPRMLYKPGHFKYLESAHYHLQDPIGRIYKGHPGHSIIPYLVMAHKQDLNDALRSDEYMKAKRNYVQWQRINEKD